MLWLILLAIVAILAYIYLIKPHDHWKNLGVPFKKPTIIFGNFVDSVFFRRSFALTLEETYKEHANHRYYGLYQLMQPIFVLKDLELIKKIAIKDFDSFVDHANHSKEDIDLMWSKNIFSIRGDKWREMRSTLSPAFTGSKMRAMFGLINDCTKNFIDHFYSKNEENITIEMKDTFTRITNDCIASCAFGINCDSFGNKDNEFYTMGKKSFNFDGVKSLLFFLYSSCPQIMKLFGLKIFDDEMTTFFKNVINETIYLREEKSVIRPDMIHLLLQARKGQLNNDDDKAVEDSFSTAQEYITSKTKKQLDLTNDDITAQAIIFFFGGFDTTSYLMSFIAYELAVNEDIQDRLQAEVDDTLAECNGELNYDALMKMKYMDMVVSETLRKWPVAVLSDRICTKEYTIEPELPNETKVTLKEGSVIWFPIYAIHRDPNIYPNPDKFDPERFNAENKNTINQFSYIPFGIGPRNCIGSRFALMENKAVVFHILSKFKIVPVEKTVIPLKLSSRNINLMGENGIWLGLKKR